ncbi:uncharacterized protein LOC134563899 [Prinia subflava]|uniref:uncharacterized protein LOC134563899 n=1 Tax=Prinia subflava TaxID=208062 RepID=UPI002FE0C133
MWSLLTALLASCLIAIGKAWIALRELPATMRDWVDGVLGRWGVPGWAQPLVRWLLIILFLIVILILAVKAIRKGTRRLVIGAANCPRRSLHLLLLISCVANIGHGWIVPQPKSNVWATLAKALGQDHICLNQASASDPMSTCLVGIPFTAAEMPRALVRAVNQSLRQADGSHSVVLENGHPDANPLVGWRRFLQDLPVLSAEPPELELLGSSKAQVCVRIDHPPQSPSLPSGRVVLSGTAHQEESWCERLAKISTPISCATQPRELPAGVFLICGDRAWAGIPSRLLGGPCTLGRLGLFTPNKTQIMNLKEKENGAQNSGLQKRAVKDLEPDCDTEITHWSKSKGVAITIFAPWVAIAKTLGELGHLECWVAKQANLTSQALTNLLKDEEITRQATLQNRAAIDYLLLLHGHTCEEFEGLCCFNLSTRAVSTQTLIQQMQEQVGQIRQETDDWLSNLFQGWGISGWVGSILRSVLMVFVVLLVALALFGILKCMILRLASSTPPAHIAMASTPVEIPLDEESGYPPPGPWQEPKDFCADCGSRHHTEL